MQTKENELSEMTEPAGDPRPAGSPAQRTPRRGPDWNTIQTAVVVAMVTAASAAASAVHGMVLKAAVWLAVAAMALGATYLIRVVVARREQAAGDQAPPTAEPESRLER